MNRRLPSTSAALLRIPALILGAAGIVALAAGCGGGSNSSNTTTKTGNNTASQAGRGTTGSGRPGANGQISQVNPTSIYVQNRQSQSQVTVNFTGSTTFTQTLATTAAAVKMGDCVTATSATQSSPAPSRGAARPVVTHLTAATVTITSTSSTCDRGGARGANRAFPSGGPSAFPRPSSSARAANGFRESAFGKVSALNNGSFVVTESRGTGGSATAVEVTVTTTPSTTYRESAPATKANLKVGLCATAIGSTDDTGAVTARAIALSTPGGNGCSFGFGGFGGFGRRGASGTAGSNG